MPGSRKRAPSTPKRTPKRSRTAKNQGQQRDLPGGALEMSFQLEGKSLVEQCIHELMLWPVPPADTLQAPAVPHHVHFEQEGPSSASGTPVGPSDHLGQEGDVFFTSTPLQPFNQVSLYLISFLFI